MFRYENSSALKLMKDTPSGVRIRTKKNLRKSVTRKRRKSPLKCVWMGFKWWLAVKILNVFQKKIKLEDILQAFEVFLHFETRLNINESSTKAHVTQRASTIRGRPGYCTMCKSNFIRGILLGIRPILGIHSVSLMISCCLLVNDSKLIDSWDPWLTIFNNWIMSSRFLLHDSWRGRSSSQQVRLT